MKTIIHVVGNRPQFIKLAVMYDAIAKEGVFHQFIIHTGQHHSDLMSGIFFDQLSIPAPNIQLQVEATTADVFIGNAAVQIFHILEQHPASDLVFVYGDTNTTLAAALATRRRGMKLLHFEAGVRTKDSAMPEEINRIVCDRLSDVLYCCTQKNKATLLAEGYGSAIASEVICSGDLMLDAFLQLSASDKKITASSHYIACTIHRAANITNKQNLAQIVLALNRIHQQTEVIAPLHPHTAKRLQEFNIEPRFTILQPLGYSEMKRFILDAAFVITDSGGASREAFFGSKKSVIIMEHPFWMEIVEANAALPCSADEDKILNAFGALSSLQPNFDNGIFGNGKAATTIVQHLKTFAS